MATRFVEETAGRNRQMIETAPLWLRTVAAMAWIAAAAVVFVPFARDTSPWNALTLNVPGDQGNWWHVLVGLPYLLGYPLAWLSIRGLVSRPPMPQKAFWPLMIFAGISAAGTALVEAPFVAQRAGTSAMQRNDVIVFGLGILVAGLTAVFARRQRISRGDACLMGMSTAYLANLAICLIVYGEATGSAWSRAGWLASTVLIIPISSEWLWLLAKTWNAAVRTPQ